MHKKGRLVNQGDMWDIDDIDGFTRTLSEYTYNWAYIGPNVHFDVYTDTVEHKAYACARIHVGADARVGFAKSYIMEIGEEGKEENLLQHLLEDCTGNMTMLDVEFSDGTSVTFDGEASDVYSFRHGAGGETGIAQAFLNWVENASGSSRWDETIAKVVDIY